jgi:tol-pal system protein YbgF
MMIARATPLLLALCLGASTATVAAAQSAQDLDRRMERLERTVRTLQSAVSQAQATGAPVSVVPEGPNPAVTAMQQRLDDMEASRRTLVNQVEGLTNQLDQQGRARASERAAADAEVKALNDRIARLEAQIAAFTAPPPAPLGPDVGLGETPPSTGGGVPTPPDAGPPPQTEAAAFARARALRTAGDFDMAAAAFQDYVARFGASARAPEAYYNLGELYYLRENYRDATAAYASALKSRPKTSWAPDAMVRLAESLQQSGQAPQACAAVAEFNQRYAAGASAAVKKRATGVGSKAKCG